MVSPPGIRTERYVCSSATRQAGAACPSRQTRGPPASYPDNFPDEAFWFAAAADVGTIGSYEAALEAAHANEAVIDGDQMGFARLRFRFEGLQANASYTVTHPYGEDTLIADGEGIINETFDQGACAPTPDAACNWAGVGAAFLGDFGRGTTATFLRQDGAEPGTLGDINTARPVTGAPSGNNFVTVAGPNAGGPGVNTVTTDLFTVQGLIAEGSEVSPSTPDLAAASDSGRSNNDNVTGWLRRASPDAPCRHVGPRPARCRMAQPRRPRLRVPTTRQPLLPSPRAATLYRPGCPTRPSRRSHPAGVPDFGNPVLHRGHRAPAVSITAPFPSTPSLDNTPTLNFTVSRRQGSNASCCRRNPTWDPTCASPKTWDAQANGAYIFNVRATDPAGNVSATATRTVHIGQHRNRGQGQASGLQLRRQGRRCLPGYQRTALALPRQRHRWLPRKAPVGSGWNVHDVHREPGRLQR